MIFVLFQAKLAIEKLNVDKEYHPFISGPRNEQVQRIERVCMRILSNCHMLQAQLNIVSSPRLMTIQLSPVKLQQMHFSPDLLPPH